MNFYYYIVISFIFLQVKSISYIYNSLKGASYSLKKVPKGANYISKNMPKRANYNLEKVLKGANHDKIQS